MIVLVRGTTDAGNYADRIAVAMANAAMQRFAKKVLCLQMTSRYRMEKVLMGKKIENDKIHSAEFSFDDTGLDALMRRAESGPLSSEQFSDCCINVAKQANSFDIAETTRNANIEGYFLENIGLLRELFKNADIIYDVVFILADASKTELLKQLEDIADKEVVCVPQGPKKELIAKKGAFFAVKNYDRLSSFTTKVMSRIYGTKFVFPFPYNIAFKDACLNDFALSFLSMNVAPDETDENYFFTESVKTLTGNVLGLEEPVMKERHFVFRVNQNKQAKSRPAAKGKAENDAGKDCPFFSQAVNSLIKGVSAHMAKLGKNDISDWIDFLKANSVKYIDQCLFEDAVSDTDNKVSAPYLDMDELSKQNVIRFTLSRLEKLQEEKNGH